MKKKIILLCGAQASGKTTLINKLKKDIPMNVISPDQIRVDKLGKIRLYDEVTKQHYYSPNFHKQEEIWSEVYNRAKYFLDNYPHLPLVVDATNVVKSYREGWVDLAKEYNAELYRIIFNVTLEDCIKNNRRRQLSESIAVPETALIKYYNKQEYNSDKNKFHTIMYNPLYENEINFTNFFSTKFKEDNVFIIGDLHGQLGAFLDLLDQAGFKIEDDMLTHPNNTHLLVLGDFVDRGPNSLEITQYLMKWGKKGLVTVLKGNHEQKIVDIMLHNRRKSNFCPNQFVFIEQLLSLNKKYMNNILKWMDSLPVLVYNDRFLCTHAGQTHDDIRYLDKRSCLHGSYKKQDIVDSIYLGNRELIHGHVSNDEKNEGVINLNIREIENCNSLIVGLFVDKKHYNYYFTGKLESNVNWDDYPDFKKFKQIKEYNSKGKTRGLLNLNYSDCGRYVTIKYSKKAFGRKLFDGFNRQFRGHVYDTWTGKFITNPFNKFENDSEIQDEIFKRKNMNMDFRIYEKINGFLFNITKINRELFFSCSGSSGEGAPYVELGKEIIKHNSYNLDTLKEDYTYMFEAIHPSDKHIVDYGGDMKLVLLSIRNVYTGQYLSRDDIIYFGDSIGCDIPIEFDKKTFKNIILKDNELLNNLSNLDELKSMDAALEGFVLEFEDGFRVKVKLLRYLIKKYLTRKGELLNKDMLKNIANFRKKYIFFKENS